MKKISLQSNDNTTKAKLENIFNLALNSGYPKLTPKQVMIAYYALYTTKDNNDTKTLSQITKDLSLLDHHFTSLIDK